MQTSQKRWCCSISLHAERSKISKHEGHGVAYYLYKGVAGAGESVAYYLYKGVVEHWKG